MTIIEESDIRKWEADLKAFPDASLFLAPAWVESFRNSQRKPVYFRFLKKDLQGFQNLEGLNNAKGLNNTIGLASGLRVSPAYPVLRKLYSPLYLFSGPAVLQSDSSTELTGKELATSCIAELINFAKINKHSHLVVKSWDYPHQTDYGESPFNPEIREEYIIDLTGDWQSIQKKMRRSVLKQIRKAVKNGLTCHESYSSETIENLIYLLEETRTVRLSKGYREYSYYYMPYLDKSLLYQLVLNKIARLFYVRNTDNVICVLLTLGYDNKGYALLIGTNQDGYKFSAPVFVLFHAIEKLKAEGVKYLNLGGVPTDSSRSKQIFAKTSLGAEKHLCSGGKTPHLNGYVLNLLNNIYTKTSENKRIQAFERWISGSPEQ